jgi:hypothetical protein
VPVLILQRFTAVVRAHGRLMHTASTSTTLLQTVLEAGTCLKIVQTRRRRPLRAACLGYSARMTVARWSWCAVGSCQRRFVSAWMLTLIPGYGYAACAAYTARDPFPGCFRSPAASRILPGP